jgi:F-type H+-transporting ATPase subunit gamma
MSRRLEIRQKMASIKNTQKITRAMEMVAAGKMRKTQERLRQTRPYRERMALIIGHLAHARHEDPHPYLIERPRRRSGLIVISSDRGLCGGLNANLFRFLIQKRELWGTAGLPDDIGLVGRKAAQFFNRIGANVTVQVDGLGDVAHPDQIAGVVGGMLQAYHEGRIDCLHIAYNHFRSVLSQEPRLVQLLPVTAAAQPHDEILSRRPFSWDYLYEPAAKDILDMLLIRYVEALAFQSLVENQACEQAARMVAMKNASDNAGELIRELQLTYNKARQAAITAEIAEIVAGSAAV